MVEKCPLWFGEGVDSSGPDLVEQAIEFFCPEKSADATSTPSGDAIEARAVREVFGDSPKTWVNNTKSFIGHAMGAAGALELAGNLPSFEDGVVHPTINVDHLDEACAIRNLVVNEPRPVGRVETILNMSFGMLGINSAVVVGKYHP